MGLADASCSLAILPYRSDTIIVYNLTLSDGDGIQNDATFSSVTLRTYPGGWIAVSFTGVWIQEGGV